MILLFGSTGYIGSEFKKQLTARGIEAFFWKDSFSLTFQKIDSWFNESGKPNITAAINASGYTGSPNVDACDLNKEDTIKSNVIIPQIISDWCYSKNITLCQISTGCIYVGKNIDGSAFSEQDVPNFSFKDGGHIYSGSKILSEKIISNLKKHYIWRLKTPFEEYDHPKNLITKLLKYQKTLMFESSISNKQECVNACIESLIQQIPFGTYNVTNTGHITSEYLINKIKSTIAKDKIFEMMSEEDFYRSFKCLKRANCILDNSKIRSHGIKIKNVNESIDHCLNNWKRNE